MHQATRAARHEPDRGDRRRPDGPGAAGPHPQGRGGAARGPAPSGRRVRLRARGVPRAGADHLLPPLVRRGPHRRRRVLRAVHAGTRHPAVVRRGRSPGDRLLPGLRRAHPGWPPLQHAGPGGAGRSCRGPLPQGPHPRSRAARARSAVPARRAPLLRARAGRARRLAGLRRARRDDDLQRPPLAGDLPGDGAPGRGADPLRVQHADPLRARPQPGHPAGLPQRAGHAVRRLPERDLGRRRGQGRRRGGRGFARPVEHRRSQRPDRRPGADHRRRADDRARCDLDWCRRYTGTLFDFDRYRRPELYGRITGQRGVES